MRIHLQNTKVHMKMHHAFLALARHTAPNRIQPAFQTRATQKCIDTTTQPLASTNPDAIRLRQRTNIPHCDLLSPNTFDANPQPPPNRQIDSTINSPGPPSPNKSQDRERHPKCSSLPCSPYRPPSWPRRSRRNTSTP